MIRALISFSFTCGIGVTAIAGSPGLDSLPPMHTLNSKDIASVKPSWETDNITVLLKNGDSLVYHHEDWDMEVYEPSLDQRLRAAAREVTKTFTRVEHAPQFPGGEEAWNRFVAEFCEKHKEEIRDEGPSELNVQFIVHMKGQLTDVALVSDGNRSNLANALLLYIKQGPNWVPAIQNGRTVVSYKMVRAKLNIP